MFILHKYQAISCHNVFLKFCHPVDYLQKREALCWNTFSPCHLSPEWYCAGEKYQTFVSFLSPAYFSIEYISQFEMIFIFISFFWIYFEMLISFYQDFYLYLLYIEQIFLSGLIIPFICSGITFFRTGIIFPLDLGMQIKEMMTTFALFYLHKNRS